MKRHLIFGLLLLLPFPATAQIIQPGIISAVFDCDYFASPTAGSGNTGRTASTAFRIVDFWSVAAAGDTLCLLNGTYQGANQMITPTSGLSGTSSAVITIRALRDGQATIDGQFARRPVTLTANSWFHLVGFNAKQGSSQIVRIDEDGTTSVKSTNNTLRRLVLWDANFTFGSPVLITGGTSNTLLEDVAAFGTGTNGIDFGISQSSGNLCRRCWVRWEGSSNHNAKRPIQLHYSNTTNNNAASCENCIVEWSAMSMPQNYTITDNTGSATTATSPNTRTNFDVYLGRYIYTFGATGPSPHITNNYLVGSIGIVPASTPGNEVPQSGFGMLYNAYHGGITISHVLVFHHPSHPAFSSGPKAVHFGTNSTGTGNTMDHVTGVRGTADSFGGGLTVTNSTFGTSLPSGYIPWTNTGSGATLCNRWVDGVVTSDPLWPWPMNDRIKAATLTAGNTFTNGNACVGCSGTMGQTRTETDVTAQMESLFGAIPSSCRS